MFDVLNLKVGKLIPNCLGFKAFNLILSILDKKIYSAIIELQYCSFNCLSLIIGFLGVASPGVLQAASPFVIGEAPSVRRSSVLCFNCTFNFPWVCGVSP